MEEEKINSEARTQESPTPGTIISPGLSDKPATANEEVSNTPLVNQVQEPANSTSNIDDGKPGQTETETDGISWVGPEFVAYDKPSSWYLVSILAAVIIAGIVYFLTKDIISSSVIALAITALGFYSLRKPKSISYSLSDAGMAINSKSFDYEEFRSFTADHEGGYLSITLLPLKRFSLPAGLCCQQEQEDQIINFLSDRLPMEQHKPDIVDSFMQRIRF